MKQLLVGILFLVFCSGPVSGQVKLSYSPDSQFMFNKDNDRGKGKRMSTTRQDQLWHAESAYVTPQESGNVSMFSDSRWGFKPGWEWSTSLLTDVVRPQVNFKHLWGEYKKKFYASSRFSLTTMYTGFWLASKMDLDKVLPEERYNSIPGVLEVGHEALFSRTWKNDPNCSDGLEYLILTFGVGTFGSLNVTGNRNLPQMRYHFLAQRNTYSSGARFRAHLKVWADWYVKSWLAMHGGVFLMGATKPEGFPVSGELRAEGEFFFNAAVSLKAGGMLSVGKFDGIKSRVGGLPFICLSVYFGKRKTDAGLFKI